MIRILQVEKSFLQNEGGCRDGVNYEKGCQQEDASADNKNHTSIPTSFFRLVCIIKVWLYTCHKLCKIHNSQDNYDSRGCVSKERCRDGCMIFVVS